MTRVVVVTALASVTMRHAVLRVALSYLLYVGVDIVKLCCFVVVPDRRSSEQFGTRRDCSNTHST